MLVFICLGATGVALAFAGVSAHRQDRASERVNKRDVGPT